MKQYLLFLSILIMIQATSTKSQTLIGSICRTIADKDSNINYDSCVTSLQAAPASRCATIKGLGSISIRLIRDNITDTLCQIKQLLKNEKPGHYVKQCLDTCFDLYSDSVDSARDVVGSYRARRFDDLNVQISSIMDSPTTCEDCFDEGAVVSPLTKRNNDAFQISAMALSIMSIIQTGSG